MDFGNLGDLGDFGMTDSNLENFDLDPSLLGVDMNIDLNDIPVSSVPIIEPENEPETVYEPEVADLLRERLRESIKGSKGDDTGLNGASVDDINSMSIAGMKKFKKKNHLIKVSGQVESLLNITYSNIPKVIHKVSGMLPPEYRSSATHYAANVERQIHQSETQRRELMSEFVYSADVLNVISKFSSPAAGIALLVANDFVAPFFSGEVKNGTPQHHQQQSRFP